MQQNQFAWTADEVLYFMTQSQKKHVLTEQECAEWVAEVNHADLGSSG